MLLCCLTKESVLCDPEEFQQIAENQSRIVNNGRDPDLSIFCNKNEIPMRDCADRMLNDIHKIAEQLDRAHQTSAYAASVEKQRNKVHDASLTPSARCLSEMAANNESHIQFTQKQTSLFANEFASHTMAAEIEQTLLVEAEQSLVKKQELEKDTGISFEDFLAAYYQ